MPEKDRSDEKSKFGRRKFIGHVINDDPRIDEENNRAIEKRHLITTRLDAKIELANIPRTQRKKVNIRIEKKEPQKIDKPLHQKILWKTLKKEIENERKKRKRKRKGN